MPKKTYITCEYCEIFRLAKRRDSDERYCKQQKRNVKKQTKRCKDFKPVTIIFCPKRNYWLDTVVCLNRLEHETYGCKSCKQGKILTKIKERFINGRGIPN